MKQPVAVLETERLILRPYEAGDLDDLAALYDDPDVTAFTKLGRRDRAQSRAILDGYLSDWRDLGFGMFALLRKTDQAYAGECGLFILGDSGDAALRYALDKAFWGGGLTGEALEAVLDWTFEATDLERIVSVVQDRNHASLRVMDKLGMTLDRMARDDDVALHIHALDRAAWIARRAPLRKAD